MAVFLRAAVFGAEDFVAFLRAVDFAAGRFFAGAEAVPSDGEVAGCGSGLLGVAAAAVAGCFFDVLGTVIGQGLEERNSGRGFICKRISRTELHRAGFLR